ncbi:hypothetical protein AEP_02991 [Curvibacter sp. AEP1-3]|uniref:hypothetical protein n=1 Tax=Curvibacter sp. AEP1-3 TaxID=1844971 RepID=UPI000B3CB05D|nr:hypothetical protein [Curvibacter sp. AEP1-3]ARV19916.1 hypothetical protein AEP_02991 [Curvibacter sp. AEP1-3]
MAFVQDICSTEIFNHLSLFQGLTEDEKTNPIGRDLIFDLDSRSALIPHPIHYSDYPDRSMNFYVAGKCFNVWELVQRSDGPDRVEIYFDRKFEAPDRSNVISLLQQAVAIFRNEPVCGLPVVERNAWP